MVACKQALAIRTPASNEIDLKHSAANVSQQGLMMAPRRLILNFLKIGIDIQLHQQ
jgi:hypothetical protein